MKQLWQTEDRAMDRLLRGQVSQRSGPKQTCKQFDPDLATAYIEQCLTATERESFEQHLSFCSSCRTAVVALTRLAGSEAPVTVVSSGQRSPQSWRERMAALAGQMATPRWAMAATALLVAAVSIPVLMSLSNNRKADALLPTQQPAALSSESAKAPAPAQETARASDSAQRGFVDQLAQSTTRRGDQTATPGGTQGGVVSQSQLPAMAPAAPAIAVNQPPAELPVAAPPTRVQQDEKNELAAGAAPGPVQSRDQAASAEQAPSKQKQLADGDQLAKLDVQSKRPASEAPSDSANVVVLKPGTPYGEERKDVKKTIRPEDSNPPPSPITVQESGRGKGAFAPPASSIHGGQKLSESVRSRGTAERKIGKKRFWLRDDVWTDNDYKPEKEMPMVPIVRDSDVFKELIGKRPSLKGYLTAFAENERAIVVYKGTIYKLIPQQDSK